MMLPIELTKILYQSWEGQISISSQDSEIYGKCLNGPGNVVFKNGNKYQGNFYNGLLNGEGKFTWFNGIVYEGQFTDNRISGKGFYRWPDGSTYEGDVKDGLRHGNGKYTIDQATYEGEWIQGKKHGQGKIIFKSGSIFEGQFQNDFKNGFGKMYYYPSGNFFEGQWRNDAKQGQGTMNWCDIRQKYVGQWKNNHQEGWGVHIWLESKGEGKYMRNRYEGNWKSGVREGFGVFYYANGSKYQGFWKNNMKQDYAFYTNENGKTSLILFNKDRMMKEDRPSNIDSENGKKASNKKEVEPNYFSLCLSIQEFYYPNSPSLEQLFNFLLRNNTQLKLWYKGASVFYEQPSQYSFCLNLEGAWKMVRSLKVLGDFSLANFDRGLVNLEPKISELLELVDKKAEDKVSYEDIYYRYISQNIKSTDFKDHDETHSQQPFPFKLEAVHHRDKNILFREFVHLLVWLSHNLDPNAEKPHKSIQKLINKIAPFLESISKASKAAGNDNVSENKSSISKVDKNITPFYKNINTELLNYLTTFTSGLLGKFQSTIKVKDLLAYGIASGIFSEAQFNLFQKIIEKYFDPDILNREKSENWNSSAISPKILNILNYELIEFEFIEIVYILLVKKLPSHKETEENKKKYQDLISQFKQSKQLNLKEQAKRRDFVDQKLYIQSDKNEDKKILLKKRQQMEARRAKKEAKQMERQRQVIELQLMKCQDINVKDIDFEEEPSQFQI